MAHDNQKPFDLSNENSEDSPVLIAQTGPLNGQRWPLNSSLLVGREDDCDIIVPSRQVSRHHARMTLTSDGLILEDLASKNGTHRNGKPIVEPVVLEDGDIIQIALAQQFIYVSSDATMPLDGKQQLENMPQDERRLQLDKRSRRIWIGKTEIIPPLSLSQFSLLELLYERQGRVVERKEMIESVWGEEDAVGVSEQALDALVRRLRDRLASVDPTHIYIVTVRGHGLRLDNPPADQE